MTPAAPPDTPAALHEHFLKLLPAIETHGRIHFRHLRCPHQRDDAVQEMRALAWKWFLRLTERGRDPVEFPVSFCRLLARAVNNGRRLAGAEKLKDALSPPAQRRHGFAVRRLPEFDTGDDPALEALRDNTVTPPPEQAAFRLDFPAWLGTRTERDRRMIAELMRGEAAALVAQRFGLSAPRVSQLRRQFRDDWEAFCADPAATRC